MTAAIVAAIVSTKRRNNILFPYKRRDGAQALPLLFCPPEKEKQKRWRKVLTKGEKGGILTKLSREGR